MTSRERIRLALNHQIPDRAPIDLDGTLVSGIAASTYSKLRRALGLPKQPVKVYEPYQILAQVEPEVRDTLGVDTAPLLPLYTGYGYRNEGWKPWRLSTATVFRG